MAKNEELLNQITFLKAFYEEEVKKGNLVMIGLNDDRGFNFKKNILMYLKEMLDLSSDNVQIVDAFSMLFNKTRHIDYFLKHNISLEEIMLMQQYGTENELKHALGFSLPFLSDCSKVINKALKTKLSSENVDNQLGLSDLITSSNYPLILYASGINDIMYRLHIDPFNLKKAYLDREKSPKYDYAVNQVTHQTMTDIMDGHKRNFENLLGINPKSDIYALSAYLYQEMNQEYEMVFKDAILMYNEKLEIVCKEYGVTYINSRVLEKTKYNHVLANYISKYPPYIIACEIIREMYDKIVKKESKNMPSIHKIEVVNDGALGIISELQKDVKRVVKSALNANGYQHEVYVEQLEEHNREKEVFEKVYNKINR